MGDKPAHLSFIRLAPTFATIHLFIGYTPKEPAVCFQSLVCLLCCSLVPKDSFSLPGPTPKSKQKPLEPEHA